MMGDFDQALAIAQDCHESARVIEYPVGIIEALVNQGNALFWKGNHDRAQHRLETALEVASARQMPRWLAWIYLTQGEMEFWRISYESSRVTFEKAARIADSIGERSAALLCALYLTALEALENDLETGLSELRRLANENRTNPDLSVCCTASRLLGQVLLQRGPDKARRAEGKSILEETSSVARARGYVVEEIQIRKLLDLAG
jgi:tetratricopeptide (TPR) repeat protein